MRTSRSFTLAIAAASLAVGALFSLGAAAQEVDTGLQKTAETAFGGTAKLQSDPAVIIGNFIKAALGFVSVIFFALIIYGGFLWMVARGNEQQIEKAKSLLTSATIGIVIIAGGYALTSTIVSSLVTATQTAQ